MARLTENRAAHARAVERLLTPQATERLEELRSSSAEMARDDPRVLAIPGSSTPAAKEA